MALEGKNILLGVSGSIAAYKAADLASLLRKAGAEVHVVMTPNATRFVTPLTLATISHHPVHLDPFDTSGWEPEHTALADRVDLFVVAPATANVIAKFACGIADDLLSTLFLAARCPVLIAPAMNVFMYENPIVRENIARLKGRGVVFSDPDYGMLACGYEGQGRLRAVDALFGDIERLAATSTYRRGGVQTRPLEGRRILVTAGPTREPLDPVRFVSNRSSGKMGYAIAEAAAQRGAEVVLISGPTSLDAPRGVRRILVQTAREMYAETIKAAEEAHIVILSAAVADYEPVEVAPQKIKKTGDGWTLTLRETPDIAHELGAHKGNRFLVGFAAETEDPLDNARGKLREKNLDLIVLNDVTQPGAGFEADTNLVTFLSADGEITELPLLPKPEIAERLLDAIQELAPATATSHVSQ